MAAIFLHPARGWTSSVQAASSQEQLSQSRRTCLRSCCKQRQLGRRTVLLESELIRNRRGNMMAVQHGAQKRLLVDVRAGFEELAHNQILCSSVAAGILGQLTKPFSSAVSGKGFNWKLVTKSGGMPSSHSALVTAAATAIAFERGLSDGVFGLSMVLAGIVMYDAQGVRNAVGKQAKVINTMVVTYMPVPHSRTANTSLAPSPSAIGSELVSGPVKAELAFMASVDSPAPTPRVSSATATMYKGEDQPAESCAVEDASSNNSELPELANGAANATNGAYIRPNKFFEMAEQLPSMREGQVDIQELGSQDGWRNIPLKESIGHTKLEVFAGGVWGVLISYALHSTFVNH